MESDGNSNQVTSNGKFSKAIWDSMAYEDFIDICVEEVRVGNRPNTHFNKVGWKNVIEKFSTKTGRRYDQKQLKNKWDAMRKEWQIWNKLVSHDTGIGWDPIKKTITATDEWWKDKLQVIPEAAKFREKGLEHCFKLDALFMDVVATGDRSWAPSSGVLPSFNDKDFQDDDSDRDGNQSERFENIDADIDVGSIDQQRKKTNTSKPTQERRSNKVSSATKLSKQLDRICDAVENRSSTMYSRLDPVGCSIQEVMEMVSAIPEIPRGGELFMLATRLFTKKQNREMFVALKDIETQIAWLKQVQARELINPPLFQGLLG